MSTVGWEQEVVEDSLFQREFDLKKTKRAIIFTHFIRSEVAQVHERPVFVTRAQDIPIVCTIQIKNNSFEPNL